MDVTNKYANNTIVKHLFGIQIKLRRVITTAVVSVVPAFALFELPALIPLPSFPVPSLSCDNIILAGVLFYMIIILMKPWQVLRFPRQNSIAFVAGLTWEKRKVAAAEYTKRKLLESLIFIGVFFALRYVLIFIFDHKLKMISLVLPELPAVLLFYLFYLLSDKIVCLIPYSKKEYLLESQRGGHHHVNVQKGNWRLAAATFAGSLVPKPVQTIVVRILLYIIRCDLFGFVFLNSAAIIISGVIVFVLPSSVDILVGIVLLVAPVLVFGEMRDATYQALGKTIDIPYWSFSSRDMINATLFVCLVITLPYMILFTLRQFVDGHVSNVESVVSYILSSGAIIFIAAYSMYLSAWDKKDRSPLLFSIAGSVLLCSMIPVAKIIFPLLVAIVSGVMYTRNNFVLQRTDR